MDKEEVQRRIEVMQAWVDGEEIQVADVNTKSGWGWCDPTFDWEANDYRIKPEPFECWVNVYSDIVDCHTTEEGAIKAVYSAIRTAVHMREVMDE